MASEAVYCPGAPGTGCREAPRRPRHRTRICAPYAERPESPGTGFGKIAPSARLPTVIWPACSPLRVHVGSSEGRGSAVVSLWRVPGQRSARWGDQRGACLSCGHRVAECPVCLQTGPNVDGVRLRERMRRDDGRLATRVSFGAGNGGWEFKGGGSEGRGYCSAPKSLGLLARLAASSWVMRPRMTRSLRD